LRSNEQQQLNEDANEPSPYVGRASCARHGGNCGRHREEPAAVSAPAPVKPEEKPSQKKD
jgi:hypothetical protein